VTRAPACCNRARISFLESVLQSGPAPAVHRAEAAHRFTKAPGEALLPHTLPVAVDLAEVRQICETIDGRISSDRHSRRVCSAFRPRIPRCVPLPSTEHWRRSQNAGTNRPPWITFQFAAKSNRSYRLVICSPLNSIDPESGSIKRMINRRKVDFPQPLGPMRMMVLPLSMDRLVAMQRDCVRVVLLTSASLTRSPHCGMMQAITACKFLNPQCASWATRFLPHVASYK